MNIEFEDGKLKVDMETVDYAMQFIDVSTKEKGMTYKEMIEDLEENFNLTDSEWALCLITIGAYIGQKE